MKLRLGNLLKEARASGRGPTLQRRLFAFFLLFLVAVMAGLFIVLVSTGVFSTASRESRMFLEAELSHIAGDVNKQAGALSVQAAALSRRLSEQIDRMTQDSGQELYQNADLINAVLDASTEPLLAALEKNTCSGVFLILNATVGQGPAQGGQSRAGVFLKNMEPNAINKTLPTVRLLRGPAFIARQGHMDMLPQWRMEFTVAEGDFFHKAMEGAQGDQELSRLYYWNPAGMLAGDYETAVLLCIPLVSSRGETQGICGFEVSAMLFKLQNMPDNSVHNRVFAMLAPVDGNTLRADAALFSGSHSASEAAAEQAFAFTAQPNGLTQYRGANGSVYIGLHQAVNLYPVNAAHAKEQWAVSVMIPQDDYAAYVARANTRLYLLLGVLLVLSVAAALYVSKRYIAPVVEALDKMKTGGYEKTHIQEIDDLLAYLARRDKDMERLNGPYGATHADTFALYEEFVRNIEALSPAERAVFDLYMQGYDAKRITEILCLSINTIKTHNRRIYQKLGISSRKELLVYAGMMKERENGAKRGV